MAVTARRKTFDETLMLLVLGLAVFGLVMVFSSSYALAGRAGDSTRYLKTQGEWLILGIVAMLAVSRIPY